MKHLINNNKYNTCSCMGSMLRCWYFAVGDPSCIPWPVCQSMATESLMVSSRGRYRSLNSAIWAPTMLATLLASSPMYILKSPEKKLWLKKKIIIWLVEFGAQGRAPICRAQLNRLLYKKLELFPHER